MQLVVGDQFKKLQDALHSRTPMICLKWKGKGLVWETHGINHYTQAFGFMVLDK